jgi:hypothetical protein
MVIKSRMNRQEMDGKIYVKFRLFETLEGREDLRDLGVNGEIIQFSSIRYFILMITQQLQELV